MTKEALEEEAYQYDADHLRGARGARWYHNVTIREAYLAGAEPREKRIAELEKKNAELKSIADFQTSNNMDRYFQLKRSKEKLNKAKEIIEKLISQNRKEWVYSDVREEAEQFLEEN